MDQFFGNWWRYTEPYTREIWHRQIQCVKKRRIKKTHQLWWLRRRKQSDSKNEQKKSEERHYNSQNQQYDRINFRTNRQTKNLENKNWKPPPQLYGYSKRLIAATRNNTSDMRTSGTTILRKQKWEKTQLYGRFKWLTSDISHEKT